MKVISLKSVSEPEVISQAVSFLQAGGLVIYPTETVYGAGVDAANHQAVAKLAKFKSRPLGKPYSVAVADQKMAEQYVILNQTAKNLYRTFLPGPLTVISKGVAGEGTPLERSQPVKRVGEDVGAGWSPTEPRPGGLAPGVASETGTLGIRISSYPLVTAIVKKLGRPVTATSANAAYKKRPYKISDILDNISLKQKNLIDLIIDAGQLPRRDPSTVIDTTLDDPVTLRVGDIKLLPENQILSRSPENTQNLAKELWHKYQHFAGRRAIVFALEGPLGAGKTEFTKGLARAMGISQPVVSPTFSLMNHYSLLHTPYSLLHIDAWRLQSPQELEDLNFAKLLIPGTVLALEWADRVADTIRSHAEDAIIIWIKIKYGKNQNDRLISWSAL